jgi:hypothetical protein
MFYWGGPTTWHAQTVAGPGTTYSNPAITETSTGANITAIGGNDTLMFYWGSPTTWHTQTVAGPGTTYADPAITGTWAGATNITAEASDGSLKFYWAGRGSTVFQPETVAGPGSSNGFPSIADTRTTANITTGGGCQPVMFYWGGPTTWHAEYVWSAGCIQ